MDKQHAYPALRVTTAILQLVLLLSVVTSANSHQQLLQHVSIAQQVICAVSRKSMPLHFVPKVIILLAVLHSASNALKDILARIGKVSLNAHQVTILLMEWIHVYNAQQAMNAVLMDIQLRAGLERIQCLEQRMNFVFNCQYRFCTSCPAGNYCPLTTVYPIPCAIGYY